MTVCHSRTPNTEEIVGRADIVIAACGQMEYIQGSWLKPGCAVIDVGINAKDDDTKKRGYRLVGGLTSCHHSLASDWLHHDWTIMAVAIID